MAAFNVTAAGLHRLKHNNLCALPGHVMQRLKCCNALNVRVSLFLFLMTGSQQSQEQANRRTGSSSDKHNENGVCFCNMSVSEC